VCSRSGEHFVASRCAGNILTRLNIRGHLDATLYTRDIWTLLDIRDIWTLLDIRGTFGRYSICGGHFDPTQCTGDILTQLNTRGTFGLYSIFEGNSAANLCMGDILTRLKFTSDNWTLLDVWRLFEMTLLRLGRETF
jgi:hypothetical protein